MTINFNFLVEDRIDFIAIISIPSKRSQMPSHGFFSFHNAEDDEHGDYGDDPPFPVHGGHAEDNSIESGCVRNSNLAHHNK